MGWVKGSDRNFKASQTERYRKTKKDRDRRWFVLKRPRSDINGESESEVTVTSKLHAQSRGERVHPSRASKKMVLVLFGGAMLRPSVLVACVVLAVHACQLTPVHKILREMGMRTLR